VNNLKEYYKDKKILITGASGFVGGWLALTLQSHFGAKVFGLGLEPVTNPSFYEVLNVANHIEKSFIGNILDGALMQKIYDEVEPDIVFHLAAQPIVRKSYKEPINTFDTNIIGTLNILNCIKDRDKKINCVIVTSDKCYKNLEHGLPFKEDDPLGGFDPYSASKAACEIVTESFANSFFISDCGSKVASARAGNIIGGGDWAEDRIVTDLVCSLSSSSNIVLRNPKSVRPWQHVLDVVNGYLKLGLSLVDQKEPFAAYNFGPPKSHELNVMEVATLFIKNWGGENTKVEIMNSDKDLYESAILRLNSSKAKKDLDWKNILSQQDTIEWTVNWYKNFFGSETIKQKTFEDINNFFSLQ